VTSGAQNAGQSVGRVASKAKTPLVAGGAALAGLAGGVALGSRTLRRRKVLGIKMPRRSLIKSSTKDLSRAAKRAGKLGKQVGELTDEVRQTREAIEDDRNSTVGAVVKGLAARRLNH
jgi:NH3-dependent NAD+ synthetase